MVDLEFQYQFIHLSFQFTCLHFFASLHFCDPPKGGYLQMNCHRKLLKDVLTHLYFIPPTFINL